MNREKIKQERIINGERFINTIEPLESKDFLSKSKNKISKLLKKVFFDETILKSIVINVRKTSEGYEQNINYGVINPSFEVISGLQEIAEEIAEKYNKSNPHSKGTKIEMEYHHISPDFFGIKRLTKYLIR